jgi:hypothetical protein
MATRKKSELQEAREKAQKLEVEEKRIGLLDSRNNPEKGDPVRSTVFLVAVVVITIVLCVLVMLALAGG